MGVLLKHARLGNLSRVELMVIGMQTGVRSTLFLHTDVQV